jgi:hypothetical protein
LYVVESPVTGNAPCWAWAAMISRTRRSNLLHSDELQGWWAAASLGVRQGGTDDSIHVSYDGSPTDAPGSIDVSRMHGERA